MHNTEVTCVETSQSFFPRTLSTSWRAWLTLTKTSTRASGRLLRQSKPGSQKLGCGRNWQAWMPLWTTPAEAMLRGWGLWQHALPCCGKEFCGPGGKYSRTSSSTNSESSLSPATSWEKPWGRRHHGSTRGRWASWFKMSTRMRASWILLLWSSISTLWSLEVTQGRYWNGTSCHPHSSLCQNNKKPKAFR